MKFAKYLIITFAVCAFCACNNSEASKTVMLSLMAQRQHFNVYSLQVKDKPYKKGNGGSGIYQVQLLNSKGNVFSNFRFGKQYFGSTPDQKSIITLPLPLSPQLSRVYIYRLNGRSGHLQIDKSDTLLAWSVPDSLQTP